METFKYRLRHRPAQPGFESLLEDQEELFKLRLELSKSVKTEEWSMKDLDELRIESREMQRSGWTDQGDL